MQSIHRGRTLVDGVGYNIFKGRTLVDGVGYNIFKGRTLVDGVGYNILLKNCVRNYAEGDVIYIKEWEHVNVDATESNTYGRVTLKNPTIAPYYVAKHNYEEELNGPGRTLLVRKNCIHVVVTDFEITEGIGNSFMSSRLEYPSKYAWHIDPYTLTMMGSTTYQYSGYDYDLGRVTVLTASHPIFAPSLSEYGLSSPMTVVDGTKLPIAEQIRIGTTDDENKCIQITASMGYANNKKPYPYIDTDGTVKTWASDWNISNRYLRPCFTIPENIEIDRDTDEIIAENNQSTLIYNYFDYFK